MVAANKLAESCRQGVHDSWNKPSTNWQPLYPDSLYEDAVRMLDRDKKSVYRCLCSTVAIGFQQGIAMNPVTKPGG
jgi:hypothetical protein